MHNGVKEDGSIKGVGIHIYLGIEQQALADSTGYVKYYVTLWRYLHPPHKRTPETGISRARRSF